MRIKLIVGILFLASPAFAQKPTVEKCRADAKASYAQVKKDSSSPKIEQSYFFWASLAEEMSACQDIDPVIDGDKESLHQGILYMGLENVARVAMIEELNNFIHRHGLQKQFVDDDDQGLR